MGLWFSICPVQAAPLPLFDLSSGQPELLALLRANYVDYDQVAGKGADLQAMIAGSDGGLSVTAAPAKSVQMFGTVLPDNIVYWRAGSFTPATSWSDQTAQANAAHPAGFILDLRSNAAADDFAGALRVATFLSQGQTGLVFHDATYRVAAGATEATLQGAPTVIVLTDRRTHGAAEVLAAALQSRGALVMGEATSGRAAIFREVPLRSGGVLRYAAAHVYLPNGVDLWNRPVVPDVATAVDGPDEASALELIDRRQVGAVIGEDAARHRMSEAALMHGQDPEQDSIIASHEGIAPATPVRAARDLALVEALDSLKAIRVIQGQESSPPARVADTSSNSGRTVIASTSLGR